MLHDTRRRIARAIIAYLADELREDPDYQVLKVWPRNRDLQELRYPLEKIARSLARLEQRRRRPRIITCEHPELHPEVEHVA